MSNDTDELVVRRFLEPLKTLEPVAPQPRTELPRRWWGQAAEVAAVAISVAVLVGVVALLAHRSPPTASPPPRSPEQLTYLHGGGIAVHDAGASTGVRLIVPFRQSTLKTPSSQKTSQKRARPRRATSGSISRVTSSR